MNKELLASRFFTKNDKRLETVVFPLPTYWWSRFYEYAWATEFCKKTDVVLDAACGIPHPFKFFLAGECKEVHAVDADERINNYEKMAAAIDATFGANARANCPEEFAKQVIAKQANLTKLPYKNSMFDKIFCISALEHISDTDKAKALKEFKRVLKKSGMLILTVDYSKTPEYGSATMEQIETMAKEAGFKLAGDKDKTIPTNAINWGGSLFCFRMVLVKNKDGE
jgi:ubiquinone/menaquinone biosynthesis C-methylase UbiE